jgi:hypothetical protein
MINFKNINLKKAKSTGINFLVFFLSVLLVNGLVKKDDKGGLSALVAGAGVALHMAGTSDYVQSAALGAAFAGTTKFLHVSKEKGKILGITLPEAVTNFIGNNVPSLSGGLNLSGLRGLGNAMAERPMFLPDGNYSPERVSGPANGGYNPNNVS